MNFTETEIRLARQFHQQGIDWEPQAGHYVYDETGFCKQKSPFQEKVYFILNYEYFMRAVGGVERFKQIMIWLPTWHDLRVELTTRGVSNQQVAEYLAERQAIENGIERQSLYMLLDAMLE